MTNQTETGKQSRAITRRENRLKRDQQLIEQFKKLYQEHRIRIDDCIAQLAEQYCLSIKTVERLVAGKQKD